MKFNNTFSEQEWETSFQNIHDATKNELSPVLIVRSDQPDKVYRFRDYLSKVRNCVLIKLGVSCTMDKIYQSLFECLDVKTIKSLTNGQEQNVSAIVKKVILEKKELIIVIDNCQHLEFNKIFGLVGLVLNLLGVAQFVFILPEDYLPSWEKGRHEYKMEIFLKIISHRYEFT